MRLRLNEQEVVDGICIFCANQVNGRPEEVDVKEINGLDNGDLRVKATIYREHLKLNSEDVLEGIFQFLEEVHNFNRQVMVGNLGFSNAEGVFAEVSVNERA